MAKPREPRRARKRTAFVPRAVLTGTFVALVPVCVPACGGMSVAMDAFSVAADAFGVADVAFPRDTPPDLLFTVARDAFGVADVAFPVDGPIGTDAADAPADRGFSVADVSFRPETGDSG